MLSQQELDAKVKKLKELERQVSDLETHIENLKNELKSEMTEREVDELVGDDWLVTWKTVISNRFDQSAFKEAHLDLFESYKIASESRRFSVK